MPCKEWREDRKQQCASEEDRGKNECKQVEDRGKNECKAQEDRGHNDCRQRQDQGREACARWDSQCCDWWPCSWGCELLTWVCGAWVWISNWVCVLWVWVSNVVCVAWVWVKNLVCVLWGWVSNIVCVLWTEIANALCVAWEAITGEPPWGQERRAPVNLDDLPAFPREFIWGAATASYQVEGRIENNDWHSFTTSPAIARRVAAVSALGGSPFTLQPALEAVQHYDLSVVREDLDRAVLLGLHAYRFSIEWSRVQPNEPTGVDAGWDEAAIDYYRQVINEVRERRLEPIVTLYHLTLPRWVLEPPRESVGVTIDGVGFGSARHDDPIFRASRRGWENAANIDLFVEFVKKIVGDYKDEVKFWITLNEPVGSLIGAGYFAGVWSPGFSVDVTGAQIAKDVYYNVLRSHVKAYDAIKAIDAEAQVGIAQNMIYVKKADQNIGPSVRDGMIAGAGVGAVVGAVGGVLGPGGLLAGVVSGAVVGIVVGAVVGLVAGIRGHARAARQYDYFNHWHLFDALIGGQVDKAFEHEENRRDNEEARSFYGLPTGEDAEAWRPRLDFIGINYYRSAYVYHHALISHTAPYMGGLFDQDYNTSQSPHNLANAMGWELSPEGLYYILTDLHKRYRLPEDQPFPIMITENGYPEPADANRAPYTVAHIEHVLAAIRDDVCVIGYLHWSLLDNWEWAENYASRAKFGLFRVDDSKDEAHEVPDRLDRHLTEGALALQYLIAETAPGSDQTGVGLTASKFGTVASNGSAVVAPTMTAGAIVRGRFGRLGTWDFTIYLNPLSPSGDERGQRWVGMIFYYAVGDVEPRWLRLAEIDWQASTRHLEFGHNASGGIPARAFTATVDTAGRPRGTFTEGEAPQPWEGEKVLEYGAWAKSTETLPEVVVLNEFEGPPTFGRWTGKYLDATPLGLPYWYHLDAVSADGQIDFKFMYPDPQRGMRESEIATFFNGSRSDASLSGQLKFAQPNRPAATWSAAKLPDGMPF